MRNPVDAARRVALWLLGGVPIEEHQSAVEEAYAEAVTRRPVAPPDITAAVDRAIREAKRHHPVVRR
jgi:hypothetical protein